MLSRFGSLRQPPSLYVAIVAALVTAVGVAAISRSSRAKIPRTKDRKPLPRPSTTLPVLHNTLDLVRNAERMHDWICDVSLSLGGKPWLMHAVGQPLMVMVSSPELYDDVERKLFDKFPKGPYIYDYLYDFFGDGIIADGELWAYQRKTAMNLFTTRTLRENMSEIINKYTVTLDEVLSKTADSEKEIDVCRLLHQFAMEAFTEIAFGLQLGNIGSEESHPFEAAFDDAQHIVMSRMQKPTFWWKLMRFLSIGSEGHLKKCMKIVDGTVLDIINKTIDNARRNDQQGEYSSNKKDVISIFLESENSKDILNPKLLRDIAMTLIIAGRDTSSEGMSWMLFCLSQHPDVEDRIRDEIREQLGDSIDVHRQIRVEELQKLTYLEAAIRETLRLLPPVSFNLRYASEDLTLSDGTFVPQGAYVTIAAYTTARRTDVWGEDAAEFKPERWIDPSNPNKLIAVSSFKFNAFLAGPRQCIGMNFAMMQMKTVLVKMLSKFHLTVTPGQNITYRHGITLPLKEGLRVRVERV